MKNTGSDTPAVATTRQAWSTSEPGRVAARMPSGTAIAIEKIRPSSVSSAEAGRRVLISVATGWPVVSETPRSPRARSADVADELHGQRLVEPELYADLLDRLLGGGGAGEVGGRVAGQRARQQERDDHHADQARQGDHHALERHAQHETPRPLPGRDGRHAFASER